MLAGTAALLVVGIVLVLLGSNPAIAVLALGLVVVLCLGQWMTWTMSAAAALLLVFEGLLIASIIYPKVGITFVTGNPLALLLVGGLGLVVLWRRGPALRLPDRGATILAVAASLPSVVMLVVYAIADAASAGPKVAWMMNNDAVWNLVSVRSVLGVGGFDPSAHPSVMPGVYDVIGSVLAPGRVGVPAGELLTHDMARLAWALLLISTVAGILFGLVAAALAPRRLVWSRAALAVAGGLVPWTWAVLGYSSSLGFWNVTLSLVALAATWLIWVEAERTPRLSSALMACSGVVLLSVWAPLVLLPGLMGVVIVVRHWRTHLRLRGVALVAWLSAGLGFVGWYVVCMRPAVAVTEGALAWDGALFVFNQSGAVVGLLLTLGMGLIAAGVLHRSWPVVGVVVLLVATGLGMAYLMRQRVGSVTGLWGYYPAKFTWIMLILAAPIFLALAASLLARVSGSRWRRAGVVAGSILGISAILVHIPPADLRSPTSSNPELSPTPDWRPMTIFPMFSIAQSDQMSSHDDAVEQLSRDAGKRVLYREYFPDGYDDGWADFWLLQLGAKSGDDPIRQFAYSGLPDDAAMCAAIDAWAGKVTIATKSTKVKRGLRKTCPNSDYRFRSE